MNTQPPKLWGVGCDGHPNAGPHRRRAWTASGIGDVWRSSVGRQERAVLRDCQQVPTSCGCRTVGVERSSVLSTAASSFAGSTHMPLPSATDMSQELRRRSMHLTSWVLVPPAVRPGGITSKITGFREPAYDSEAAPEV